MKLKRYNHDLSYTNTTTAIAGKLVPVGHTEVLPGDTFNMKTSALIRVQPLNKPLMHEVECRVHHWFVPNRILWAGWEDFITGVVHHDVTALPLSTPADLTNLQLYQHCGGGNAQVGVSYHSFLNQGYNTIWNEFYRDQEVTTKKTDTEIKDEGYLKDICWNKDYFTTARKQPQLGSAVAIPLSIADMPIKGLGWSSLANASQLQTLTDYEQTDKAVSTNLVARSYSETPGKVLYTAVKSTVPGSTTDPYEPQIYADAQASASAITVDQLRESIATQRIAEARSLFGERYTDYLAYYGVKSSDARLQRPEYLGGWSKRINFSEVLTTDNTGTGAGQLYGHGIAHKSGGRFRKMFEEHGTVWSLLSIRPLAVYQQGKPRKFSRTSPLDYWSREFENTPWQAIKLSEIYSTVANSRGTLPDDPTWGYTSRFDEYRESHNMISADLQQTGVAAPDVADYHWARYFDTAETTVDHTFVTCSPNKRVFQDQSSSSVQFIIHLTHDIKAKRLVSKNAEITHAL
ncbi:MAG: major capsid protein [Microviridae sp.]|nr:MAG: major capsid protein [Microviridae sp.]